MYSVTITSKSQPASEMLKREFSTIDDKFKERHNQNFAVHGEAFRHGLKLFNLHDGNVCIFVHAHNDYYHLKETYKDVKKSLAEVMGSLEGYVIEYSW